MDSISDYVREKMSHPGHDYSHILRLKTLVKKVVKNMRGVDKQVLDASVELHDIMRAYEKKHNKQYGRDQQDKRVCHAKLGAIEAKKYLSKIGFPKHKISKVVDCIESHRYSTSTPPESIEARILQECDRLDATGAIGILRTSLHNAKKTVYHPTIPLPCNLHDLSQEYREVDDWTYGLDHFFHKLLHIKDSISIPEIKPFAIERHEYMVSFLTQLEKEIKENLTQGPANTILNTIRKYHKLELYDVDNPFSKNPGTLVGRILLLEQEPFIQDFIQQLKKEIL
jgi:uncharacterized protein